MNPVRSLLKNIFPTFINQNTTRNLHKTIICLGEKATGKSDTRVSRIGGAHKEHSGSDGAESWINMSLRKLDERLPTPETMKKLFNGTPYDKIPLVYIRASKNNTVINAFDCEGRHLICTNSKKEGFVHAKKKTSIAAQTTGVAAGERLIRKGIHQARVFINGFGVGRVSGAKGIAQSGITVVSITDRTPIKEKGPRPRKLRRI